MLISRSEATASEFQDGLTFSYDLDSQVDLVSIGLLNLPSVPEGRLWIKVLVRGIDGIIATKVSKWRTSQLLGMPSRPVHLNQKQDALELPHVSLPDNHDGKIWVNVAAKRAILNCVVGNGSRLYITARDGRTGMKEVNIRSIA